MKHLDRIHQLDEMISRLDRIIDQGEHVGAGLAIGIRVGPMKPEYEYDLEVELSNKTRELLGLMREDLFESRRCRILYAKQELKELQDFFADLEDEAAKSK